MNRRPQMRQISKRGWELYSGGAEPIPLREPAGPTPAVAASAERLRLFDELLDDVDEYFDNRADADHDGEGYVGNEEMRLLSRLRDLRRGYFDV